MKMIVTTRVVSSVSVNIHMHYYCFFLEFGGNLFNNRKNKKKTGLMYGSFSCSSINTCPAMDCLIAVTTLYRKYACTKWRFYLLYCTNAAVPCASCTLSYGLHTVILGLLQNKYTRSFCRSLAGSVTRWVATQLCLPLFSNFLTLLANRRRRRLKASAERKKPHL